MCKHFQGFDPAAKNSMKKTLCHKLIFHIAISFQER